MSVDFNSLPNLADQILKEVLVIKDLVQKIKKPEEVPKHLNLEDALQFIKSLGLEMSKSQVYKKVASKQIPYRKIGNRLIFNTIELNNWFSNSIKTYKNGK